MNIIEWPILQCCAMSGFGGDREERNAMLHKSSFFIIDEYSDLVYYIWFKSIL